MNTRDPRPTPISPGFDPAQLSFGDVSAIPQLRVDRTAEGGGGGDDASAVLFREPPVCGESSYDDVEDAGPSWSVRIVQEVESAPGAARARAASHVRSAPTPPPAAPPAVPVRPAVAWTAAVSKAAPATAPTDAARPGAARPPVPARPSAPARPTAPTRPSAPTRANVGNPAVPPPPRPAAPLMPSAALDPLKRSTELSPRDADAAIAYAHALEKHGSAAAALTALDDCLTHGGDELRLICARAFLLGSRLQYDLAEAELKKAIKIRADDPEVHLQTGVLACRRARWRDAVEPLQRAASQRSDDALAHFYLGEALNHVDQLAAALAAYENSTKLDSSNWRAFKGVGIVLDRMGRPAEAAIAYRHMREAQGR